MSSFDNMKARLQWMGGNAHGRNVKEKYRSLMAAIASGDYQNETILTSRGEEWECLINRSTISYKEDLKEISIPFEAGLYEGDSFYWIRTDTHWYVYLQQLTEEAYFRGSILRCNYQYDNYWVYVRGPIEQSEDWHIKHNIAYNDLNYTLLMYIPKNEDTLSRFSRGEIIKFDGHNWRVVARDQYSQDSMIQVYLAEHYDDVEYAETEVEETPEQDITQPYISGPASVEVYSQNNHYEMNGSNLGKFIVNSNKVKIMKQNETSCEINISTGKSGVFELQYVVGNNIIASMNISITPF